MPYSYKFINKLDQLGMVHYTLILEDSKKVLPDYSIHVMLKSSEDTVEKRKEIAENILHRQTQNNN
jgi:hypothetical protein